MSRELSASALLYGDEEGGRTVDVGVSLKLLLGVSVDLGSRVEEEYGDTVTVHLGPFWLAYWHASWRQPLGPFGTGVAILAVIVATAALAAVLCAILGVGPGPVTSS